jgi:hypothetical protein
MIQAAHDEILDLSGSISMAAQAEHILSVAMATQDDLTVPFSTEFLKDVRARSAWPEGTKITLATEVSQ